MKVAAPEEIPLPVDAILMDVVTALGQTGGGNAKFDVTFRDQTGALVTVCPTRTAPGPNTSSWRLRRRPGVIKAEAQPPK